MKSLNVGRLTKCAIIPALLGVGAWGQLAGEQVVAAASSPTPSTATTTVTAPLHLVCVATTPSAVTYAEQNGRCPGGSGVSKGTATPYGTVYGNCGASTLDLYDQFNGGWMDIYEAATSTQGPIVYANWSVGWYNWNDGRDGNKSGSMYTFSSNWWHWDSAWTTNGYVTGSMQGWVVTATGAVCNFLSPSASVEIS